MIIKPVIFVFVCFSFAFANPRRINGFYKGPELNKQIKIEYDAAQSYLHLSNLMSHDMRALHGFAKMFKHSWKKELGHAKKLMEYGIMRGHQVETPEVTKDENRFDENVCKVIDNVLKLEKLVYESLLKLHQVSRSFTSPDPQFQDFIENEFLKEQVESIKFFADLLTKIERATNGTKDTNCDGLGLHFIDEELSRKFS